MKLGRMLATATVLAIALATMPRAATTSAITWSQAEAPIPVHTADPHEGGVGDVADLDTKEPAEAATTSNIVLLVAALAVLLGVLIVTRRKSGPGA